MKKLLILFFIITAAACKEKYVAPFEAPAAGYLVVEGNINNGSSTTIVLTRSNTLTAQDKVYETGASVVVAGENNVVYTLNETTAGNYFISNMSLDPSFKYRLDIKTKDGKQYYSDYVVMKTTPPIDSLTWIRKDNGVEIYVNAHDDQRQSNYYQWDYQETWEFHSPFSNVLAFNDKNPNDIKIRYRDSTTRTGDPAIATCWKHRASTTLLIGSTVKLTSDRVYLPINYLVPNSQELSVLYSIYVRQTVLSKEAYEFLEMMKKNTEATGSIFDAQPSSLQSNIHCVQDPAEPVIGFVNVSSVAEKRLFIKRSEVVGWRYNTGCENFEIQNHPDSIKFAYSNGYIPTEPAKMMFDQILSFYVAYDMKCIDCTLTGSNVKPSFWP